MSARTDAGATTYDLAGRVALVTGGSSGIGRATAAAFGRAGARVVVADVQVDAGEAFVAELRGAGVEAAFVRADVSTGDDVRAMVARAVALFGGLDYAFNNAGVEGALAETADYAEDAWQRVIAINLTGVFLCMKHELPVLLARGGGAIVNNASILGFVGFARTPAYTASKHGVLGLTKVTAQDYATRGIRVNAVCPGIIETPMVMERGLHAGGDPETYRQLAALHPMNRLGRSEEIADAVLWLCAGAGFVTGEALVVDGGFLTR